MSSINTESQDSSRGGESQQTQTSCPEDTYQSTFTIRNQANDSTIAEFPEGTLPDVLQSLYEGLGLEETARVHGGKVIDQTQSNDIAFTNLLRQLARQDDWRPEVVAKLTALLEDVAQQINAKGTERQEIPHELRARFLFLRATLEYAYRDKKTEEWIDKMLTINLTAAVYL